MPIYEYECEKCGAHTEVLQKMGDKPLTRCSTCRGKMRKAVSRSSFQLKGGGWYVTDYAKKGSNGESKSESPKADTSKTETSKPEKSAPAATASSKGD
jgi:putative FmdB family regulatory protein